jgi:DNA repair protein RecN (Recombination protein N)
MIERFYLKDYLSFKNVELSLSNGLVVFTGPSGSGKSILINSILSSLGSTSCEASICESSTTWQFNGEDYGLESEELNVFKHIKKEKSRYFINNQSVSKKSMYEISSNHLKHLSLKDYSDFENENLINILDNRIEKKSSNILELKSRYKDTFLKHKKLKHELLEIEEQERKIVELKEFAKFEIEKIEQINPKIDEDVELLEIKKELSRKEKVLESLSLASEIFNNEHNVFSVLDSLEVDSSFFSDAMNELRATLEGAEERFSALDEVDVEDVLNRLEELSELKRRYGSIEDTLEYKKTKIAELEKYENIEITKGELESEVLRLSNDVNSLAEQLSSLRREELSLFESDLNRYLKELYLRECKVFINSMDICEYGKDKVLIELNNTSLDKISTGEFNRLRLAILAIKSENMERNGGVLMLDEIDANLSGEESMSVAKVLKKISKYFQIFVISHQPQLTSMGEQHFLVYKQGDESKVKELDYKSRIDEIARIISGDKISSEAKKFAKELLDI